MSERQPTLQETAYHEAGHAVISMHFGLAVNEVTIRPDLNNGTLGSVSGPNTLYGYEYAGARERRKCVRQTIIGLYAGLEAEKLINPHANEELSGNDETQAFDLLRDYPIPHCGYVGDDVYCAYLEKLRKEARRMVKRLRPMIASLADELLSRTEMTGQELEDFYKAITGRSGRPSSKRETEYRTGKDAK